MSIRQKKIVVPVNVGTTDSGGLRIRYGAIDSVFKYPGGPLINNANFNVPQAGLDELKSNLELNYAALSDSAAMLQGQNQQLEQFGVQPEYVPQAPSNALLWGLLAGLVVLFILFSK